MDSLMLWIDHYGYIVLFSVVMLELLALPISGQAVMAYCGFLAWKGSLNWAACIVTAGTGAALGITTARWLGMILGTRFFEKYGQRLHIGPERLKRITAWMEKYGSVTLIFAYYIPGVRHFTGYISGITKMPYLKFAVYAYTGAYIWAIIFVSLGRFLGEEWKRFYGVIDNYLLVGSVVIAVSLVTIYLIRKNNNE